VAFGGDCQQGPVMMDPDPCGADVPGGEIFAGTWEALRNKSTANSAVQLGSIAYCTSTRGWLTCLFVDADGSIWSHVGHMGADPQLCYVDRNHWNSWAPRDSGPESLVEIQADGGNTNSNDTAVNEAGRPGIMRMGITGTANSRAGFRRSFQMVRMDFSAQVYVGRYAIRVDEELTDSLGDFDYAIQLGPADVITSSDPAHAVYLTSDGNTSPNFIARTVAGAAPTDVVTPVAFSADAWHDVIVDVGTLGGVPTARFVINGSLAATITTTLPTAATDLLGGPTWIRRRNPPAAGGGDMKMFADYSNFELGAAA